MTDATKTLPDDPQVRAAAARRAPSELARLLDDPAVAADLKLATGPEPTFARRKARERLEAVGLYEFPPEPEPAPPRPSTVVTTTAIGSPPLGSRTYVAARSDPSPTPDPIMVRASEITAKSVEYLWPGRIPRDRLAIFMGLPDQGKSTFMSWFAAVVTSGGQWPDSGDTAERGSVIILQKEEVAASDIVPRLEAFGADMDKVHLLDKVDRGNGRRSNFAILRDCDALEAAIDRLGDVRAVIFDPVGSYLQGVNGKGETEVRDALEPLKDLAERKGVAIILLVHLNKDGDKDVIHRASGSSAFVALARIVWYVSADPNDPSRRMLSYVKGNPEGLNRKPLAFAKVDGELVFDADCGDMNAKHVEFLLQRNLKQEALKARRVGRPCDSSKKAEEVIRAILADGPMVAAEARKEAAEKGVPDATFRRVAKELLKSGVLLKPEVEGDPRTWIGLAPTAETILELPLSDNSQEGAA